LESKFTLSSGEAIKKRKRKKKERKKKKKRERERVKKKKKKKGKEEKKNKGITQPSIFDINTIGWPVSLRE
jgi:hypothetical protein